MHFYGSYLCGFLVCWLGLIFVISELYIFLFRCVVPFKIFLCYVLYVC
jgi:hypothetical protein